LRFLGGGRGRDGPGRAAVRAAPERRRERYRPADETLPAIEHKPITSAPAEKPLTVTARVTDPSGVKWVRLRYRSVNQYEDFKTLPMPPTGEAGMYAATVPAADVVSTWDFMYLIEALDSAGRGRIFPDLEKEAPYVVVHLDRAGK